MNGNISCDTLFTGLVRLTNLVVNCFSYDQIRITNQIWLTLTKFRILRKTFVVVTVSNLEEQYQEFLYLNGSRPLLYKISAICSLNYIQTNIYVESKICITLVEKSSYNVKSLEDKD